MSASTFTAPAQPGGGITWETFNGCLLVLDVHGVERDVQTTYGASDAVKVTVHVLDGPEAGTSVPNTLVFPKVLRSQLEQQVGERVLGRLGQGNKKPGQNPPWILEDPTEADRQTAQRWLASQMSAPSESPAADDLPF